MTSKMQVKRLKILITHLCMGFAKKKMAPGFKKAFCTNLNTDLHSDLKNSKW